MNTEISTASSSRLTDVKRRVADILVAVSWKEIANRYFGKSSSWLYHKLDGIDGNGGIGGFSPSEADQLRSALNDLADRIKIAAASI